MIKGLIIEWVKRINRVKRKTELHCKASFNFEAGDKRCYLFCKRLPLFYQQEVQLIESKSLYIGELRFGIN